MNITTLGIDIAKNVFQLHGEDRLGNVVLKKRISRGKLPSLIANLPPCLIGMEACGGAHYWSRRFQAMGHQVKLMGAQFVKPYVKSNKNDACDAEAICEAVRRPNMRFVGTKTVEQEDIQATHRARALLIRQRTALANQIRGLLAEYGVVMPQGISHVRKQLPEILENAENELTMPGRELFDELGSHLLILDEKIELYNKRIERIAQTDDVCKRLMKIDGVGPLVATALVATIGNAGVFKNGREMAAYLGLVPRQHSSGGKQRLCGISKRGDRYVRCLLVHGARSVLFRSKQLTPKKRSWLDALLERCGRTRTICALANKTARVAWVVMAKGEDYDRNFGIQNNEACGRLV